jgi:beta-mannosidase
VTTRPSVLDLSGTWTLTDGSGEFTCPMRIPGDGITALQEAGLIPDPYWGRNEYGLRWIAERDWTIRRIFTLEDDRAEMELAGLDTVVEVRVNGEEVFAAANAFRSWRASLADVAREGENEVAITFRSAVQEAARLAAQQPFPVPYIAQNNPIPHGNMLRKVACDWGWDWNIALCPFGVTGEVLVHPAKAIRIAGLDLSQHHDEGGRVRVVARVQAENADGAPFEVTFAGQTRSGALRGGSVVVQFALDRPGLWWPAGLGAQTLHDLTVRVGDATATRRIGLRTIELVTQRDAAGLSFGFRVNGRMVFAKGANWIPADALAGRITKEKTRDLLQSAVDANMNMIRVWGGGRYEPDSFYEACDELGLMVWQDFMFSCNLYPSTPEFLREVEAEVRENVARLHHHACLALWCGDNELIGALTWFPESKADRDRYLVSYDRLNRTIEAALKETDPTANWWPSSPSPGPLNFRDAWHEDGSGDMHFWSVWHESKDFEHYRDVSPRFCSEFGFQSYPSMDVIRTFVDPADMNIASPVPRSHQRNASPDGAPGGNPRIASTLSATSAAERFIRVLPSGFPIPAGIAIKTAVTDWRSKKPHCQGALYWQLNDTWPAAPGPRSLRRVWKVLHHHGPRPSSPVIVTAVPDPKGTPSSAQHRA